jgi:ketosteroid isomerase-like protein
LVPGAPPIRGRAAIAAAWKAVIGSGGNKVRVDVREVQDTGDWAFEVGAFTATAPDGITLNSGKYIVVWKRDPVGVWKSYRDIFHWDIAPGGAAT